MEKHYVDIHCHPSLKPFSKSFKYQPTKQNALDPNRKNSIWHYSPPNFLEKLVNRLVTLTKFTQTDITALARAKSNVVIVSLYPFEKHFFGKEIIGIKGVTDVMVNLAASISQARMDYIRSSTDYFLDLMDEYQYYQQLDNLVQTIDGKTFTYRLVRNFQDIENNFSQETESKKIINIILSIEGGHSFNTGLHMDKDMASRTEVIGNIKAIKNWEHRPIFLTLAHHFYNELCGHAPSITMDMLKKNQERGMNSGITDLGLEAIELLLDNTDGKRIPIDVKHLSTASREAYYQLLDTKYASEKIPVVASHGACNGKHSIVHWDRTNFMDHRDWFCNIDINFYDTELIRIAKSDGLFGIQLDERRIGSDKAISESRMIFPNKRKQLNKKALLVWRQVQHIAEVLDKEGLFCWGIQCIGSDFDGIVNPINGLWTAENMKDLAEEMLNHAENYLSKNLILLNDFNRINAEDIVERVMHINAMEFIQRNY
ncbi:membrane dipeptidase [Aequorivita sp. SDUM287046]|uniref:Membrane dipeptidase n=1 Tax=Aequorivita aurantiaca TaxID=3053356 RepID=A0ABT8DE08_9FLAO|nr:membrane dipeptidase [Aequorivita aurantiaca]MDN3723511.1 membrane dipeptidase [Aequorivita aurantiaca]